MGTATPLPSATVILARDCSESFEVLMVKRHHQIDFASYAAIGMMAARQLKSPKPKAYI